MSEPSSGHDPLRSVASARWLVGVTAGVAAAFLLATAASQYIETTSATNVHEIVANAMPSVQLLAAVRGDLRMIDFALSRTGDGTTRDIADYRRNIDAALATYQTLPFFPGEARMYAEVPELLRQLDHELAASLRDTAHERIDDIDRDLERIVTLDAAQGQRLGLAISHARSESRALVWLLDTVTVLLAAGAIVLAVRQRRRAVHSLAAHQERSHQRVRELTTQVDELGHFAGRVAHDIRGPLQTAMLSLEITRTRAGDPSKQADAGKRASAALERVRTLVDGLLEFARAGGRPETGAIADAEAVIAELVEGLTEEARAGHIELRVGLMVGGLVRCSRGVLTSIAANLIRNAIRHMGDAAERRIEVSMRDADPRIRVEVLDTGPGIPPGHERRIFEPYVQLRGAKNGLGLGLATVDRLVRAHGGTVGVVSPPGHGCLFWFELPRCPADGSVSAPPLMSEESS